MRDIATSRSLWQRIFGVGTVTVLSSDKTMPTLVLKNVKDPIAVKEMLHKSVEEMKLRRRVRIGELTNGGDEHDCHHDDEMDDPLDDDDLD